YPAPLGASADCATAPTMFSNNNNYFSATYGFAGACGNVTVGGTVNQEITYSYEGMHIGEVDIVEGKPYNADYLFSNFRIPSAGLNTGDQFVITIELSPELDALDPNDIQLFTGATAVAVTATGGAGQYALTF